MRFYFLIRGKRDHVDAVPGICAGEAARRIVDTLCGRYGVRARDLHLVTARLIPHGA